MENEQHEEEVTIENPKAVLAALERAKEDAKKYREQYEALVTETDAMKEELGKMRDGVKADAIRRKVEAEGADPDRVMQFLKTEGIEYKDGELEGFEDNFKALKTALPELFDPKRRVGGKVELETKGENNATKSVTELQVDRLLRNVS